MQRQLEFWPIVQNSGRPRIWEALTPEERAALIAALARLITKTVRPETVDETQENKHEQ